MEEIQKSENDGGGLYKGGVLMEMDLTKVEIRWGNCEKMADVLTRDVALWSRQGHGCKKTC